MSSEIPLAEMKVTFTAEAIRAYGGPGRHLHADEDVARALGFPGLVSWGTLTILPFQELMARIAGPDWETGSTITIRLSRPVCAGDEVTYSAQEEVTPGGARSITLTARSSRAGTVATAQATCNRISTPEAKGAQ